MCIVVFIFDCVHLTEIVFYFYEVLTEVNGSYLLLFLDAPGCNFVYIFHNLIYCLLYRFESHPNLSTPSFGACRKHFGFISKFFFDTRHRPISQGRVSCRFLIVAHLRFLLLLYRSP